MKMLRNLSLFALVTLLAVGCNKEDLNKQETKGEDVTNMPTPKPCDAHRITDENGTLLRPAELSPEDYAAAVDTKADVEYTIPVVFHIFGISQGSGTLNAARMEKVLTWINNDFNGIKNAGDPNHFDNINEDRKNVKAFMPIKFVLAKNTKDGFALADGQKVYGGKIIGADNNNIDNSATVSGDVAVLIYAKTHPLAKTGPGNNASGTNAEMKKIAWDNKMYMNVYILNDLYANKQTNNSGVAWYPGTVPVGTERVVYNGSYLPGGSYFDKDFTSVITHEFGHFMNLAHTFNEDGLDACNQSLVDGGNYGDGVTDTPQMENSSGSASNGWQQNTAYWGHGKINCNGEIIDFGNFMNYGYYCNFTEGQVVRMKAALNHAARKPLWQQSNLDKVLGAGKAPVEDPAKDPATVKEKLDALNKK